MMGRQSGQMSIIILDLSELIPENHLLRKINQMISFDFIYDFVAPYYPTNGRPSVDPVSMFKMLLVEYLYGVKSERRLVQEVQLNIAYRWFCGFELTDKSNRSIIPRYRKVGVSGTHASENHDFISSDQGSRSSISKSLFCSARSGIIRSR